MSDEYAEDPHGAGDVLELARTLSAKPTSSLPLSSSRTRPETQIPPGFASAASRIAMLTAMPHMSAPSAMTSPTLMPTRNSGRLCDAPALRLSIVR